MRNKTVKISDITFEKIGFLIEFYSPHPKNGESTVFTGVCLFTVGGGGGVTLVPGSFLGHWS